MACDPASFISVGKDYRFREVSDEPIRVLGVVRDLPGENESLAPLLVADVPLSTVLTERSSRIRQFKLAKKVLEYFTTRPPMDLGSDVIAQGVFVFHDAEGRFRVSLVTATPENGRFNWSKARRQSFYVTNDPDANATFVQRMCMNWGTLKGIKEAFSVEKLTKEFYNQLFAWYERVCNDERVEYPNGLDTDADNREDKNRKHIIRLITRLMFVWFLKQKKLVPDSLFDEEELKRVLKNFNPVGRTQHQYYRAILQNLFFATLNSEVEERGFATAPTARKADGKPMTPHHGVKTKYRYADEFAISRPKVLDLFRPIPFLNGGLFECLDQDGEDGKVKYYDGFSLQERHRDRGTLTWAHVPNDLFFDPDYGIIPLLRRYNFTVEENSPGDEDVALDPELLGKVFENLLGAFNPETKEVARNATGSFYTPREIVNYMVDESLIAYLTTATGDVSAVKNAKSAKGESTIRALVTDGVRPTDDTLCTRLAEAIEKAKILDPACGSGAFPMGALLKMVELLRILKKLPEDANLYDLKLKLIENCIFGSDIQEIAVQISKLRIFISLVCEQKPDMSKPNYGINPLPNLETKFVAANSLIGLQKERQRDLFFETGEIQKTKDALWDVRHKHFTAQTRREKNELREKDKVLRKQLAAAAKELGYSEESTRLMASWDPYNQNVHAEFFDPEWMFNVKDGFDIVISNPPYIRVQMLSHELIDLYKMIFSTAWKRIDISTLFIERLVNNLTPNGVLCYIMSNQFLSAEYGRLMRRMLLQQKFIDRIVDFGDLPVFEGAITYVSIFLMSHKQKLNFEYFKVPSLPYTPPRSFNICEYNDFSEEPWSFVFSEEKKLLKKLQHFSLITDVAFAKGGIITGNDECFIFTPDDFPAESDLSLELLRTDDIRRYYSGNPSYQIFYPCQLDRDGETRVIALNELRHNYPLAYKHISRNAKALKERKDSRIKMGDKLYWYQPVRFGTIKLFSGKKILTPGIVRHNKFVLDDKGYAFSFGNMYALVPRNETVNIKALLGILNSAVIEFFLHRTAPLKQGGYYSYNATVLERIPLAKANLSQETQIADLVDRILAAKKRTPSADTSALEREIDEKVYRLYGLTDDEIRVVEGKNEDGDGNDDGGRGATALPSNGRARSPSAPKSRSAKKRKPKIEEEF